MKWMQETTVWEEAFQPNHIYLMEGDKAIAYIRQPTNETKIFSKPLQLDLRGRKFKELDLPVPKLRAEVPKTRKVQGSKGETYEVNDAEGTCTCPGFRFRGNCRHLSG
jgi:hypothetical protein